VAKILWDYSGLISWSSVIFFWALIVDINQVSERGNNHFGHYSQPLVDHTSAVTHRRRRPVLLSPASPNVSMYAPSSPTPPSKPSRTHDKSHPWLSPQSHNCRTFSVSSTEWIVVQPYLHMFIVSRTPKKNIYNTSMFHINFVYRSL